MYLVLKVPRAEGVVVCMHDGPKSAKSRGGVSVYAIWSKKDQEPKVPRGAIADTMNG
jgi:hypothetical protein